MSRGFKWTLLAMLGVLAVLSWPIVSILFPGWNCTKDEINVKTGQGRRSRYVAFIRVSQETYGTALSQALERPVDEADIEAWHPVNTFSPPSRGYSPHYRFHGALCQAHEAGSLFRTRSASPPLKAAIAEQVLVAWQRTGCDESARAILRDLWEDVWASNQAPQAVSTGAPEPGH